MLEGGAVTSFRFHSLSWANSREEPPEAQECTMKMWRKCAHQQGVTRAKQGWEPGCYTPNRSTPGFGTQPKNWVGNKHQRERERQINLQNKEQPPATMKSWACALPLPDPQTPSAMGPWGICHSLTLHQCLSPPQTKRGAPGHCPSHSAEIWAAPVCQSPSVKSQSTQQKTWRVLFM